MKHLKKLGLAALAALALAGLVAPSASATKLEVNGAAQTGFVTMEASLKAGTSSILSRTDGSLANTCTSSSVAGTAHPPTSFPVWVPLTTLSFTSCERPVTVHGTGELEIEHISGSTNGTVKSSNAWITVGSPFGTLSCRTGFTDLGTLTGNATFPATIDVNAVLNCGFLVPSASWKGTYTVTSPWGLGVVA